LREKKTLTANWCGGVLTSLVSKKNPQIPTLSVVPLFKSCIGRREREQENKYNVMGLEIVEPNSCIRGCCTGNSIPLHLPPSSYTLLSPIAKGM
jgi:hypothetical protein